MGTTELIDEEISQYLPQLNPKQKEAVLNIVKEFASGRQDWWDEIAEDYREAIDKSIEEMKEGKLTQHEEVMEKYNKWTKT